MHDDYLWDDTGELDAEVVALQRTLAPLRYEADSLRPPRSSPQPRTASASLRWVVPALAAAAALTMVFVLRPRANRPPDASVAVLSAQQAASAGDGTGHDGSLARVSGADASRDEQRPKTLGVESAHAEEPTGPTRMGPDDSDSPSRTRSDAPKKKTRSKPARPAPDGLSVDCLLDPELCTERSAEPRRRSTKKNVPTVDCILDPKKCESLPEKLTSLDVRAGMRPVKSRVEACGPKHGALADSQVKVKLWIKGTTGRVATAKATGEWQDTPLGRCAAKAVSKARFPRFKRVLLGVQYPFTMRASQAPSAPAESAEDVMEEAAGLVNFKARGCAVAHDVPSGTRVDLELKISAKGRVTKVQVLPRDPLSSDATRCLRTAIGKTVFTPSAEGGNGRISLSL